jgi:3-hydroxybutyryl-CoA dehydrogenase
MDIERVGIVGAGQMGNGIANVFALAGYSVVLNDVDQGAIDRALSAIRGNLDRQVTREKISAKTRDDAIARISTTLRQSVKLSRLRSSKICFLISSRIQF